MSLFTVWLVTGILYLSVDVEVCRADSGGLSPLTGEHKPIGEYSALKGFLSNKTTNTNGNVAPDKYVTGGSYTGIFQYPWLVRLTVAYNKRTVPKMSSCGGSLLSSRHVVTAAHCVNFPNVLFNDVNVYLAEYNTAKFGIDCMGTECIQNVLMHPDQIIIHAKYDRWQFHNDIAMLRLSGQAPNTGFIRPISLPSFNINAAQEGTPLIVTGWGESEHGQPSTIKRHAKVHLVAPQTCRSHYPVTEGMVCAASTNGQDHCRGDSGGPLMVQESGNFYLVGIVSFRIGHTPCGSSWPSMYTNVYPYLSWIQFHMWN